MTTRKLLPLAAMILFAVIMLNVHSESLTHYLSAFIPNSTISASTLYNTTFNGSSYVIMQLPGTNRYLIILNASTGYSVVTNVTTIESVLTPFLSTKYYPSTSTLASLNATMRGSQTYSSANLTACLVETGLDHDTCTFSNTCFSCQSVPVCKQVLNAVGGPISPFGYGIMNFEDNYTRLNNSYNSFYSLINTINRDNAGTVLYELSADVSNITAISKVINQNPIFPPPLGTNFAACGSGLNPLTQPWYCVAVGFCFSIPFNQTALDSASSELSSLKTSLPSHEGVQNISVNSSIMAQNYINAELETKNGQAYNSLITTFTLKFNNITGKANALLSKYNNATLNQSVSALRNQFNIVVNAGVNQNVTLSNITLQRLLTNTISTYQNTNATYNQVYALSQNNSATLLEAQLNYQRVPTKLAALANEQQTINSKLNTKLQESDVNSLLPDLQSIRVESALYVAPVTAGYMIKVLGSPFVTAILASSNQPVQQRLAIAPMYASLETLIIDAIIIVIIFILTYFKIIRKGKIKGNKRAKRMWILVFIILIILAGIDIYATNVYATNANSNFMPFSYFLNSVKASSNTYIALNGSAASNSSIIACTDTIKSYLTKANITVQTIKLENYSCVSGSNISTLGINCYSGILNSNKPVIFISQSQTNNITYKGLYGTVLYANGNVTAGKYCTLSTLFRNV